MPKVEVHKNHFISVDDWINLCGLKPSVEISTLNIMRNWFDTRLIDVTVAGSSYKHTFISTVSTKEIKRFLGLPSKAIINDVRLTKKNASILIKTSQPYTILKEGFFKRLWKELRNPA